MKVPVSITINGRRYQRGVEPRLLLVHFIRDLGGITGTKVGCDTSQCGSCTVDVDANFSRNQLREGRLFTLPGAARRAPVWIKRALTAAAARVA